MVIGFTGTKHGMTEQQKKAIADIVNHAYLEGTLTVHHGCCVGADTEFALLVNSDCPNATFEAHPCDMENMASSSAIKVSQRCYDPKPVQRQLHSPRVGEM